MKKKLIVFIFLMCALLTSKKIVAGHVFGAENSNNITITFDVDKSRLQQHLPDEFTKDINNFSRVIEKNSKVNETFDFGAVSHYYNYAWTYNGNVVDLNTFIPNQNVTLKINWQPIEYKIYYNYLTEKEKTEIKNIQFFDYYSVEKQVAYYLPKRDGYKFVDWYLSPMFAPEEVVLYTDKYSVGDKYIYAKWQTVEYYINYHTDAENLDNPPSYNVESTSFTFTKPKKQGHIFKGWFYDIDFKTKAYKITTGDKGNLDLYPLWELEKYTVKYVLPTGKTETHIVEYGKSAPRANVKTNMFEVLKYSTNKNYITGDCEIVVTKVNIWYVYLIALCVLAGVTSLIIISIRKRKQKLHKLRQIYLTNLHKRNYKER